LKAVLDTNVLISALIKRGKPRSLLNVLFKQDDSLITSEHIVEEFSRVSADEKIRKYADDDDVADFLSAFLSKAVFVSLESKIQVLNDPDDKVLAVAKAGGADLIVTGDRHMLDLEKFGRTKIVTVEEALLILRKQRAGRRTR
jgi:putative PIN family toxin of toxin-antitoxin system